MRSLILVLFLFFLFGCSNISSKVPVMMPDKSIEFVELNYIRWFNQSIDGFYLQTPDGWILSFDKQGAENKASFKVGPYDISIGDSK